mgnify:FL=1
MKKCFKIAIIVGAMLLSMLNMTACNGSSNNDSSYTEGTYFENVMPYQAQDLSDFISVSGTVESESSMNVTSSVNAKITKLNVAIGDYVNEGDVLCVFDNSDIKQQITDLETSIKNASALDENTKKLNRKALENAKEDQKIQLKSAKESIDSAKDDYNKTYKKYSDCINNINSCVLEYNDVCNQIAEYESSMSDMDYSDNQDFYDDSYDGSYDDSMDNFDNFDNYDDTSSQDDTYSSLIAKREELSAKIESYKTEASSYEDQLDPLQKAIDSANDNYDSVKRSTNQAIETAQNTVDIQDYQNDSSSNTATQLKNLKTQLEECTVKAEKSGTVTSLSVAEGDTPTEGALLMTIENNSQLKITANIDEKDILKVKEGMNVVITSEATGDTEIKGKVSKVITIVSSNGNSSNPSDDSSGGSSSNGFTAEITIDGNSDLLVGMKAKAKIMLVEKSGCYSVLYDCIMYDDNGNPYVLVADTSNSDNGTTATVKRADVTLGDESGSYVEVTSDSLKENDLIITTPYEVAEGDTIELSPYVLDSTTDVDVQNIKNDGGIIVTEGLN